jgi:large subunit ribosomal protein L20
MSRVKRGVTAHRRHRRFMCGLGRAGIEVDRKVLADLAVREPEAFKALVDQAVAALD